MNNIPLYVYSTFCLSIHLSMDIWVVSTFWLLWIRLLWLFMYKFCVNIHSFLLDVYLGVRLLDHVVNVLAFWGIARLSFKVAASFYLPTWSPGVFWTSFYMVAFSIPSSQLLSEFTPFTFVLGISWKLLLPVLEWLFPISSLSSLIDSFVLVYHILE